MLQKRQRRSVLVLIDGTVVAMFLNRFSGVASACPRWLGRLLFLLFLWQLAGLFWLLVAPARHDQSLSMPRAIEQSGVVSHDALLRWYGAEEASDRKTVGDFSLMAVIAGQRGAALFKGSDGASVAVRVGETIRPDSKLVSVEPTQATIERGGVRQILKLPQTEASPNALTQVVSTASGNSTATPAQKTIPVTRGQLLAALQGRDVDAWDKGLGTRAEGGIRVDRAAIQPFAKLLQFKDGDILKSVNGRPLTKVADISLIAHHFGQQTAVDIVLIRNGATLTQHYPIQP